MNEMILLIGALAAFGIAAMLKDTGRGVFGICGVLLIVIYYTTIGELNV